MKEYKLNYRFHNPNPAEVAADYILIFMIEAHKEKVDQAIQDIGSRMPDNPTGTEDNSA
jgi:hypothetical protein